MYIYTYISNIYAYQEFVCISVYIYICVCVCVLCIYICIECDVQPALAGLTAMPVGQRRIVLIYVYLYIHTHTHTHIYVYNTHTHTHTYIYIYKHTHTHKHTRTRIHTHMHVYSNIYIHAATPAEIQRRNVVAPHSSQTCKVVALTHAMQILCYGVVTISRLLKIIGLFCKKAL